MPGKDPIDIGSDRQLFVDDFWIDESSGVKRKLQRPLSQGIVIPGDKSWDRGSICVLGIIEDDGGYRAWYRCDSEPEMNIKRSGPRHRLRREWTTVSTGPSPTWACSRSMALRKTTSSGWGPGTNLIPFKDPNPDVPEDERYKGFVRTRDLFAMASPDGIHWRMLRDEPIMTDGPFDSPNTVFWDDWREEYVAYTRGNGQRRPGRRSRGRQGRPRPRVHWRRAMDPPVDVQGLHQLDVPRGHRRWRHTVRAPLHQRRDAVPPGSRDVPHVPGGATTPSVSTIRHGPTAPPSATWPSCPAGTASTSTAASWRPTFVWGPTRTTGTTGPST